MTTTTLTWASSGNGTKTGTTINTFFDNLDTLITSKSGNAAFSWQKAGKVSTGAQQYLLLSRKDGSAGRIALIYWVTTQPAFGNAAIFDQTPFADTIYIAYFPAGTANTLSNLAAASGTMCGVDTGAVKAANGYSVTQFYQALFVPYYWDSYDGIYLLMGDPASGGGGFCVAAGALLEDTLTGTAVDATFGSYYYQMNVLNGGSFGTFTGTFVNAGSVDTGWRANYAGTNKQYYMAWGVTGWSSQVPSTLTDIMSDPTNNKYWYAPIPLIGQTKGEGIVLKIRQVAYGSGSTSAFATYYTTGPVTQAMQMCNQSAGGTNFPWLTNFKV